MQTVALDLLAHPETALAICQAYADAYAADDLELQERYGVMVNDFEAAAVEVYDTLDPRHIEGLEIVRKVDQERKDWWDKVVENAREDDDIPF
jgi:hypothetical protein